MEKIIKCGFGNSIVLKPVPTCPVHFNNLYIGPDGKLTENNNRCDIEFLSETTPIISDISQVQVIWLFYDASHKLVISYPHSEMVTLTKGTTMRGEKNYTRFRCAGIPIPLSAIFENHWEKLLGINGTLSVKLYIENLDPIELDGGDSGDILWDYTYSISIFEEIKYSSTFTQRLHEKNLLNMSKQKDSSYKMGCPLSIDLTTGFSIPSSTVIKLVFWENDESADNVKTNYKLKILRGSIYIYRGDNNITATTYTLNANQDNVWHIGCNTNKKLNFFNGETSSPERAEFNACVIVNPDDINDITRLKDCSKVVKIIPDCIYCAVPEIQIRKKCITIAWQSGAETPGYNVCLQLELKNLDSRFPENEEFIVVCRSTDGGNLSYSVPRTDKNQFTKLTELTCNRYFNSPSHKHFRLSGYFPDRNIAENYYAVLYLGNLINSGLVSDYIRGIRNCGLLPLIKAENSYRYDTEARYRYIGIQLVE